jgi:MATE family multidrug resistance protein
MSELRTIARHAGTVLVGQLATMGFGVADTMIAGRYDTQALAALSVGAAIYISVFVALVGGVQALLPIWAELRGAGRSRDVGRSVRQALYICAAAAVIGMAILFLPDAILRAAQIPPALESEVRQYLRIVALALPAALLFRAYSTLNQALGKPALVTWLQTLSLLVKVPLSIWLTFGGFGVPAMGLAGCAWGTVIVNYLLLLLAIWALRTQSLYAPYAIWARMERPDPKALREFARLGVPTSLAVLVEVTSFTLMALFIARLGTEAAASHQIAASLAGVLYMVPLSLGIAASSRVSYWLGAGHAARARHAAGLGYKLALVFAGSSALLLLVGHDAIARVYAGNKPALVAGAGHLLLWLAVYHFADALQAVGVFLLRSYGVATRPLVLYCVLLWGVGLGGGYVLAYVGVGTLAAPMQSPSAFWSAGAVALLCTAVAFMTLLSRVARQARGPVG